MSFTLSQLNGLSAEDFVRAIGPAFEHSPWIAVEAAQARPFSSRAALHAELCNVVRRAGKDRQLSLIRAHPDLVGRLAQAGRLTNESMSEQASAGLTGLTPAEVRLFETNNSNYRARFGFPFVICARLNKKSAILQGFAARLKNSPEQEIATALEEIYKIAELRLQDFVPE